MYIFERAWLTDSASPSATLSGWPTPFRSTISAVCSSIGVWTSSSTKMMRLTETLRCGPRNTGRRIYSFLRPADDKPRGRAQARAAHRVAISTALLISVWPENSIRNMRRRAFRPDDAPGHRRDPAHAEDARPDADGPRQARGSVTVHRREGREAPDEPELRHRPADHERARDRGPAAGEESPRGPGAEPEHGLHRREDPPGVRGLRD